MVSGNRTICNQNSNTPSTHSVFHLSYNFPSFLFPLLFNPSTLSFIHTLLSSSSLISLHQSVFPFLEHFIHSFFFLLDLSVPSIHLSSFPPPSWLPSPALIYPSLYRFTFSLRFTHLYISLHLLHTHTHAHTHFSPRPPPLPGSLPV